eukprot:116519-Pelagomonas_calceolata.AAC.2
MAAHLIDGHCHVGQQLHNIVGLDVATGREHGQHPGKVKQVKGCGCEHGALRAARQPANKTQEIVAMSSFILRHFNFVLTLHAAATSRRHTVQHDKQHMPHPAAKSVPATTIAMLPAQLLVEL